MPFASQSIMNRLREVRPVKRRGCSVLLPALEQIFRMPILRIIVKSSFPVSMDEGKQFLAIGLSDTFTSCSYHQSIICWVGIWTDSSFFKSHYPEQQRFQVQRTHPRVYPGLNEYLFWFRFLALTVHRKTILPNASFDIFSREVHLITIGQMVNEKQGTKSSFVPLF